MILTLLSALTLSAADNRKGISTSTTYGDRVITHMADGGAWKTTITVVNLSRLNASAFTLHFYDDAGNPKVFPFVGIGQYAALTGTMNPGGSLVIETSGYTSGATQVGWASFDYSSSNDISGFAIFTNQNGQEAVVPFESSIVDQQVLAFDNTKGHVMGVALANSSLYSNVTVTVTVNAEDGSTIGTDSFLMRPLTHQSYVLTDRLSATANRRGTMYLKSDGWGLAVLGLRFNPQGAFTSVHSLRTHN